MAVAAASKVRSLAPGTLPRRFRSPNSPSHFASLGSRAAERG